MRGRMSASLIFAACLMAAPPCFESARAAEVVISVNKATQSMSVLVDGAEAHNWTVSTGTGGGPPDGTFRPERLHRHWFSRTFNMAPMPFSIFFQGPYAIHGTDKISQLGRRASKGCVRLHPRDAAVLFELVGREKANTTIVISKTTHVAARVTPAKSDVTAAEAAEPVKVEAAAAQVVKPEAASASQPIETVSIAPVRKRARAARQAVAPQPPPYSTNYAAAQ